MTLVELLIAMTIMVMVVGAMGTLARGVQQGFEYTEGHAAATQHARVSLQRMETAVREATANEQFPGMIVISESAGPWQFPNTLVVWHPDGSPADPDGLPRFDELVVYCCDPAAPNELVELTFPFDARTVPPVADRARWALEIGALKKKPNREAVTLTDLVRTCAIDDGSGVTRQGAVRFVSRLRPSQQQWDEYVASDRDWDDWNELPWVQGIFGSKTGLRQAWVRIELQLMPGKAVVENDSSGQRAIPFPGSAALYHEMRR